MNVVAVEPAQIDSFIQAYGDDTDREVVHRFVQVALRDERLAEPEQLAAVLSAARNNWLSNQARHAQRKALSLPELNFG